MINISFEFLSDLLFLELKIEFLKFHQPALGVYCNHQDEYNLICVKVAANIVFPGIPCTLLIFLKKNHSWK